MIMARVNPGQLVLQVLPQDPDGISKDSEISTAVVRVYHIESGNEVEDLASIALSHIPASKAWRYIWEPTSLAEGQYLAEYTFTDLDGEVNVSTEDISIGNWTAPTAEEIDDQLSDTHGDGSWECEDTNPCGRPSAIPGV